MICNSMACDNKTDRVRWNLTRKNSKSDGPLCQLGLDSIEPVPRPNSVSCGLHVDAFHLSAALLVTFLPNNGEE